MMDFSSQRTPTKSKVTSPPPIPNNPTRSAFPFSPSPPSTASSLPRYSPPTPLFSTTPPSRPPSAVRATAGGGVFFRRRAIFVCLAILWTIAFIFGIGGTGAIGNVRIGPFGSNKPPSSPASSLSDEALGRDWDWDWDWFQEWKESATRWVDRVGSGAGHLGIGTLLDSADDLVVDARPKRRLLNPWPSPKGGPVREEPKFLSYLPHSGFHNQRQAFQNALALSLATNRILLVPPLWLGQAPGYLDYDFLSWVWDHVSRDDKQTGARINPLFLESVGSEREKWELEEGEMWEPSIQPGFISDDLPAPLMREQSREERMRRYKFAKGVTFVSFDFLFDMGPVVQRLKNEMRGIDVLEVKKGKDKLPGWVGDGLLNRWYGNGEGIGGMGDTGVGWEILEGRLSENDIIYFKDKDRYDYAFSDYHPPDAPLINDVVPIPNNPWKTYNRSVNIQRLREAPQKLVLVGSLFGTSRINLTSNYKQAPEPGGWGRMNVGQAAWAQHLVLGEKKLVKVAKATKEVLRAVAEKSFATAGHRTKRASDDDLYYVSAHARVTDGPFKAQADEKMMEVWEKLVDRVLDLHARDNSEDLGPDIRQKIKRAFLKMNQPRREELERQLNETLVERSRLQSRKNKRAEFEGGHSEGLTMNISPEEHDIQEVDDNQEMESSSWSIWDSEVDDDDPSTLPLPLDSSSISSNGGSQRLLHSHKRDYLPTEEEFQPIKQKEKRVVEVLRSSNRGRDPPLDAFRDFASRLTCHSRLHVHSEVSARPDLRPFNIPLYLATDSRHPAQDPVLSIFYTTFPCLFTYSDVKGLDSELEDEAVANELDDLKDLSPSSEQDQNRNIRNQAEVVGSGPFQASSSNHRRSRPPSLGFRTVESWVNAGDGVPLGRYMIPIIDAMIAARGAVVIGTHGSTFSQYIERVLWPAVHSDASGRL